jgi:hypothetical protein
MFLFDPSTGETFTEPRSNMDAFTVDACKGAIDLLEQQPCEDCISRQATIDTMETVDWYHINKNGQLAPGANSKEYEPLYKAEDVYKVLNDMPSVQPEERTETPACDCISRQAAIRIASGYCHPANIAAELSKLPSAQPYTEAEIQKMQELEQAELEKAFKLGKADVLKKIRAEIMSKDGLEEALEIIDRYTKDGE